MPPRVISCPISSDPVTAASGPCNLIVHRAPTNEVPTNLRIAPLILSFTDRKKNLFLLPDFPLRLAPNGRRKAAHFVKIITTFTICNNEPSFYINQERIPLSFLRCSWSVIEFPPLPTPLEKLTPLCSQNLWLMWPCEESPWRQFPGNLRDWTAVNCSTSHTQRGGQGGSSPFTNFPPSKELRLISCLMDF